MPARAEPFQGRGMRGLWWIFPEIPPLVVALLWDVVVCGTRRGGIL